jgi:hypothetical protein
LLQALDAEANWTNWSLFQRFIMARELLDAAEQAGPSGMAFIFVWLRLSANRQLDWYRNSNYQSKDIAHVQKVSPSFVFFLRNTYLLLYGSIVSLRLGTAPVGQPTAGMVQEQQQPV